MGQDQGSRPLRWCNRLTGRWRGATGSGFQPTMVRAHFSACAVSVMPGSSLRSSTAADNSPPRSKVVRIAAASASLTTNILGAWGRAPHVIIVALYPVHWAVHSVGQTQTDDRRCTYLPGSRSSPCPACCESATGGEAAIPRGLPALSFRTLARCGGANPAG
jgi:hypothetical protein